MTGNDPFQSGLFAESPLNSYRIRVEAFEGPLDLLLHLIRKNEVDIYNIPIAAITCVADMQKRGFWYTIRAWGFGLEQESWMLKCGFIDTWEGLRRIMFEFC